MTDKPIEEHYQDFIVPFLIDNSQIRGRLVRVNTVVDTILNQHQYPEPVSRLLAEMIVLASMLSANLKPEGILTVQVKSEGLVKFMIVDAIYGGQIRGYAEIEEEDMDTLDEMAADKTKAGLKDLLGKGYLAITLDSGAEAQRYQGIVELAGDNLSQALHAYFSQSQQVEVAIKVAIGQSMAKGGKINWTAGGVMIERMPLDGGTLTREGKEQLIFKDTEDQWETSSILMQSVRDDELIDPTLSAEKLLFRLFNEDGVWVHEAHPLQPGCRCSRERISNVLRSLDYEEIKSLLIEGKLEVNCQFCNKTETFSELELKRIHK